MNLETLNATLSSIRSSNLGDSIKLEQIANARTAFVDAFIDNIDTDDQRIQYLDREDFEAVAFGKLSLATACDIAYNRWLADQGNEADMNRVLTLESQSRRRVGTAIQGLQGPARKGCKDHGKAMLGVAGSGGNRYNAQRLYRVSREDSIIAR